MTAKEMKAPFYTRDGRSRELTVTDYATISGIEFNHARRILNEGIKLGLFSREILRRKSEAYSIFKINERS